MVREVRMFRMVFWFEMSMLYGVSPALFGLYSSWLFLGFLSSSSTIALDLARMATCKAVSPDLSVAVTFAFLSRSSWTISRFLFLTALSKAVFPSSVAASRSADAPSNNLTREAWLFTNYKLQIAKKHPD